jgi:tripartite-type tricarboxylate transporter receptor subunit TctC
MTARSTTQGPVSTARDAERPGNQVVAGKAGVQTVGNSPDAFASFIKQDIAIWKEVADQAKVEVR